MNRVIEKMVLSNLDKAVIAQGKLGRFLFSLLPIQAKILL